ncbi:hypothetical protein F3Y22_tig00111027pilonHSYRG00158 [Hibiscus syriacus]|uniref:Uncharacterized protein n=1 Tax=Hibiscus syriacus TaxID=106335 RepID=A0A6A2Z6R6_HIBSY|nr:hypothetical protein F3Y22_tig00111027pilonHSYRG00158 [Hibiscus syriacus]
MTNACSATCYLRLGATSSSSVATQKVYERPFSNSVMSIALYAIGMRERNSRLFGGKARPLIEILEDIKDAIRIRMSGWHINRMDLRNAAICANWGIA